MSDDLVIGYWKGVSVTETNRVRVDFYFEHVEGVLRARFEAPERSDAPTKGELKVLLEARQITMVTAGSEETLWFTGQVVGEPLGRRMIHGLIHDPKFKLAHATLTIFAQHHPKDDILAMYA